MKYHNNGLAPLVWLLTGLLIVCEQIPAPCSWGGLELCLQAVTWIRASCLHALFKPHQADDMHYHLQLMLSFARRQVFHPAYMPLNTTSVKAHIVCPPGSGVMSDLFFKNYFLM